MRPISSLVPIAALALLAAAPALAQQPLTVTVRNKSVPTLCAEDDNVYLTFQNPKVRHFRVEARAPAVIGSIAVDSRAPDFTNCTIKDQPPGPEDKVEKLVLFEDDTMQLVGYRHSEFWRKGDVPLKVGDREEKALYLVQLFTKTPRGPYEHLVLYPLDGYWRLRPLPPARLDEVAYGTSVLIGPIEENERPFVSIKSIKFTPKSKTFDLTFPKGDQASIRVAGLSEQSTALEVTFENAVKRRPFAALRSMYVTDVNADSSQVAWRAPYDKGWRQKGVMEFGSGQAHDVWLGRAVTSKHNTSAPDTALFDFQPE
ncbi:hypothetical protein SLNSH_18785 [Alsobacter soli]|uniref:Uncharacterized protein n=1 Tax=Alsobacter soli TaxID=2109933 RepID=A0A2T1HP45_9HYPH|nr:hypothetical protein [Alsobacter soli]PSC03438.1 hypothetical protein SLNSH_18785 [Alsobacter soli]